MEAIPQLSLILLITFVWITFWDAQSAGFVSDDIVEQGGIANYDGKLQKPISFHNLFKLFRYYFGLTANNNRNWKKDKQPQFVPSPSQHHRLNLYFFSGAAVLLYCFLFSQFGNPLAFLSTLLFIAHPLGCQTVVWVSGVGYCLSLLFAGIAIDVSVLTQPWMTSPLGTMASVGLFAIFEFLAVQAQFAAAGVTAIMLFMGYWPHAIISAIITVVYCTPVLKDAVDLRVKTFKDQQMGDSTKVHWKKLIVVMKTIYYYAKMSFFPKRMGLYHTFGYHYELPNIEAEDKYFWTGLLILAAAIWGILGCARPVQFAIVWFFSFIFMFLNWITIHQFVSERYNWVPSLGACILITWACVTWHILPIYYVILGIALMRTWAHIPTFNNEVQFYQSNLWNFPDSEVALGNMGVTYMRMGLLGAAHDMWNVGTRINQEYDVNWYNLYSIVKGQGQLEMAKGYLVKALSSRTCHFPQVWIKELEQTDRMIEYGKKFDQIRAHLAEMRKDDSKKAEAANLEASLTQIEKLHEIIAQEKNKKDIEIRQQMDQLVQSVNQANQRQVQLDQEKKVIEQISSQDNILNQKFAAIDAVLNAIQKK